MAEVAAVSAVLQSATSSGLSPGGPKTGRSESGTKAGTTSNLYIEAVSEASAQGLRLAPSVGGSRGFSISLAAGGEVCGYAQDAKNGVGLIFFFGLAPNSPSAKRPAHGAVFVFSLLKSPPSYGSGLGRKLPIGPPTAITFSGDGRAETSRALSEESPIVPAAISLH